MVSALVALEKWLLEMGGTAVWTFLNTNFSAALFGALAGALAAHGIASRAEKRKQVREQIAGVNSAIALANTISNAFVAMKGQHVIGMAAIYKRDFDAYIAVLVNPPAVPTQYNFIGDFRVLQMPVTPIDELRRVLLERVQSCGAAISISVVLHQCINSLAQILALRDETFGILRAMNDADRVRAYFGLKTSNGNIDERNPNQVSAIIRYVEDGIYFPILLVEVLIAHGERLRTAYGRGAPTISKITYKRVANAGLLPDPAEYPDFEEVYRPPKGPAPTRWQRLQTTISALGGQDA